MAILKIARMGHPVLAHKAHEVADPSAPEMLRLVADMLETLEDAEGTGLAAPQVHVPLRLVVFRVAGDRTSDEEGDEEEDGDEDGGGPVPLTVLFNPVIEALDDEVELGWEACLSLPGLMGEVPRHRRIRYRGLGPDGRAIEREATGFHARVVQHECDHLDGILYPQRVTDLSRFGFVEEMRRWAAEDTVEDTGEDETGEREREMAEG